MLIYLYIPFDNSAKLLIVLDLNSQKAKRLKNRQKRPLQNTEEARSQPDATPSHTTCTDDAQRPASCLLHQTKTHDCSPTDCVSIVQPDLNNCHPPAISTVTNRELLDQSPGLQTDRYDSPVTVRAGDTDLPDLKPTDIELDYRHKSFAETCFMQSQDNVKTIVADTGHVQVKEEPPGDYSSGEENQQTMDLEYNYQSLADDSTNRLSSIYCDAFHEESQVITEPSENQTLHIKSKAAPPGDSAPLRNSKRLADLKEGNKLTYIND